MGGEKVSVQPNKKERMGITPAWAGKSLLPLPDVSSVGDHPRMGGEKVSNNGQYTKSGGSPPHGRGKVHAKDEDLQRQRITPAWAGKSICHSHWCFSCKDHPRMGGEKKSTETAPGIGWGSPPHGRGKDFFLLDRLFSDRITPAWAGKSLRQRSKELLLQDHPRMGGEKGRTSST